MKWSDIEGNILHTRRSIAQKLKGGDVETPPKNKSSYRDLQIPSPLLDILAEHKERQRAASKLFSEDFRVCGTSVVCGGERPLRDTSIDKHNRAFAIAAELPHIRIHDFRHTHASLFVNEGIKAIPHKDCVRIAPSDFSSDCTNLTQASWRLSRRICAIWRKRCKQGAYKIQKMVFVRYCLNIQEIARRLGHSNVQMTWNTYSHLYPREEERAVAILNKISP